MFNHELQSSNDKTLQFLLIGTEKTSVVFELILQLDYKIVVEQVFPADHHVHPVIVLF